MEHFVEQCQRVDLKSIYGYTRLCNGRQTGQCISLTAEEVVDTKCDSRGFRYVLSRPKGIFTRCAVIPRRSLYVLSEVA